MVVLLAVTVMLRERTSVLLLAPVQWYGKISYSLYILHAIPGYIIIHALWPYVGRNMAMLVALAVVSVLAWALQKYGEVLVVVLLAVTVMLRERTSVLLLAPVQWYGKIS
ncbi:hypothetical protein D9B85_14740, partial [Corynebacterium diphtheriae]